MLAHLSAVSSATSTVQTTGSPIGAPSLRPTPALLPPCPPIRCKPAPLCGNFSTHPSHPLASSRGYPAVSPSTDCLTTSLCRN